MLKGSDVEAAIARKEEALLSVYHATEKVFFAREALTRIELKVILNGLQGSNAEARKADLTLKTLIERSDVDDAEQGLRKARLQLELAENELLRVRYLLRLMVATATEDTLKMTQ